MKSEFELRQLMDNITAMYPGGAEGNPKHIQTLRVMCAMLKWILDGDFDMQCSVDSFNRMATMNHNGRTQ